MKSRRLRSRRAKDPAELNITAFLNLMVILVPFLLITAVFSRMAVLELNLPGASEAEASERPPLALEVTVRDAWIEVGDRHRGAIARFDRDDGRVVLESLSDTLQQLKAEHPSEVSATLLLEPDIAYDVLVQVMDVVRLVERPDDDGAMAQYELFPDVSIGDAPAR